MTLQDTIKGLKEIEYAWEMAESEQDICLKDTYLRSIYSATKYLENEDTLISCVSDKLKNSVSINRVLEIVDDADRKANDKTYIILDDGIFYSQVKYIKEKILELLEE